MNNQSMNFAPDDRDHSSAWQQPAESNRSPDNDNDGSYDSQDGYDDGLVHSHGWATSDR